MNPPPTSQRNCDDMWLSKSGKPHGNKGRKLPEEALLLKYLDKTSECWLFTGGLRDGYGAFGKRFAHRKAYELWVGPIPTGLCVLHKCDVRRCCNPAHLFLGDRKANTMDAMSKGRHTRGAKVGISKLNESLVAEIRSRYVWYSRTQGCGALAKEYGVHPSVIHDVITGKTWKHV
jgi:hypothetical protein